MTYTRKLLPLTVSSLLDSSILILIGCSGGIASLPSGTCTRTLPVFITIDRSCSRRRSRIFNAGCGGSCPSTILVTIYRIGLSLGICSTLRSSGNPAIFVLIYSNRLIPSNGSHSCTLQFSILSPNSLLDSLSLQIK